MLQRAMMIGFLLLIYCIDISASTNVSTDESALLAFKAQITNDPNETLSKNWTQGTGVCSWIGISCSTRHQRVVALNLKSLRLRGSIPKEIGNLSFLSFLQIGNNTFIGEIPDEIGRLKRLKYLSLQMNNLTGEIPQSLGFLSRLEVLDLSENDLFGIVPLSIFNISSLKIIDLNLNDLTGTLPNDMCSNLPMLQYLFMDNNGLVGELPSGLDTCTQLLALSLSYNRFTGNLPRDMWNMSKLQDMFLGWNELTGTIPSEIQNLPAIQSLSLRQNDLVGTLPPSLGNLSTLVMIDIGANNLHGNIPTEFAKLVNLKEIYLGSNKISGQIVDSFYNISGLEKIAVAANELSGTLPSNIAHNFPNLNGLYLGLNQFTGTIPSSISNVSKLTVLDLGRNFLSGDVPMNLGNLQHLEVINLQWNQLTNDPSTGELGFLTSLSNCKHLKRIQLGYNFFRGNFPKSLAFSNWSDSLETFIVPRNGITGEIPVDISKLSNLVWLSLGENELIGSIPQEMGNMKKLQRLSFSSNKINGTIPKSLCNMEVLYLLGLAENQLSGEIPSCLGSLSSLRELYLDSNALGSNFPPTFWSNKGISILSLSSNLLNGVLPLGIGSLNSLSNLNLSRNQFTGKIPSTMGQLQNLVNLSLSMNNFEGLIPESFGDLVALAYLDLSGNNLSGIIPESLENLKQLSYLNVSFNALTGKIPNGGPFANLTAESFMGNTELCGPSQFNVVKCRIGSPKRRNRRRALNFVLASIAVAVVVTTIFMVWFLKYRKRSRLFLIPDLIGQSHKRISYYEVVRGTNNFDEANLIGRGGLGLVYRGTLPDGNIVAVKVFNTEVQDAFRRFDLECEVLRNIRHRNLVKVISSCANLDFKALVLEYMPNGDLDTWLYSHNNFLDLIQRLKVMIDVASAMEYLHEGHSFIVVHCDLKPSNILLDENMVARVSDFGISKLLTTDKLIAQTKTLGTIGYMAPEYGSEGLVSTMGDVYSYGILLMETFTRKKPMDDLFVEELTLKRWVFESFPDRVVDIVDANLFSRQDEQFSSKEICIKLLMELALQCTSESPQDRITMKDVLIRLNKIQTNFSQSATTGQNGR
ncbi:probable LRR receptor-like serine/threonine-protein kinase At3g47570 [Lycium ferocissimum]|uniref:probable LRR receptor-like serine/threonine-protein kinase At3g47570 n=1 Tax=Lycium ferocissimum TaxID=112874 RepID=UPI002814F7F6|nr:probable LRR receptor-like serine/threonine-protein kinase At3g47570 [Lycium ferocissimum]